MRLDLSLFVARCRMGKKVKKEVEPPPKDVFEPLLIESKAAATVVLMLDSPEEEVLAKACEAIYKFASKGDENKVALLGLGAVERLYKLISHEDPIVRRNAMMVFGIMASNKDVIIHEFATLCLAHMAVEYSTKVQILEQGGLEPLISLLGSPDPDVTKNSVECIYLLVQEFNDLHVEALAVLGNCLEDVHTMQLIQQTGGLKKLLSFVGVSTVPDIQKNAAKAIAKAACDFENRKILNEEDVENCLINLLEIDDDGVKVAASQAISAMCENIASKRIFGLQGIPQLVQLLSSDNEEVKEAAVIALANLTTASPSNARNPIQTQDSEISSKNRQSFMIKDFLILKFFKGISGPIYIKKTMSILAVVDIITESGYVLCDMHKDFPDFAVAEAEGIEPLVKTLKAERHGAIANAAAVLTNMAMQEPLRLSIQSHGVLSVLTEPLRSASSQVQSRAALTVAAFGCDANARNELRNAGGLGPLVELLHSKNKEVRRNACWAVMVCASDELTAAELCRLGALDILEEINLSTGRRNNFSEAALERLLDNSLSQKYSQMGYLSSSNVITDGFYDYGKIKPGIKFLSLEELSKQELTDRRAVIFINARPQEDVHAVEEKPQHSSSEQTTLSPFTSRKSSREKVRYGLKIY
ncbi:hypothetical protein ASZ78_005381 [Callipepla squamata]|uniref:Armadillo repeat-containing protein 3 n=1 Tax=Callipepla squamata TaxID=9009 RepID=A0A226ML66_CALSU|nr:hypothetical protein ASZ78_005381 [Callipepla squamata]